MLGLNRDKLLPAGCRSGAEMAAHPIDRRGFSVLLGSVVASPFVARAQQANNPFRIGFVPLGLPTSATDQSFAEAFRKGLRDVGLIENRDITIDIVCLTTPKLSAASCSAVRRFL
jgi:hypothetical protein